MDKHSSEVITAVVLNWTIRQARDKYNSAAEFRFPLGGASAALVVIGDDDVVKCLTITKQAHSKNSEEFRQKICS